ncbi:MAG TPA: hypothetical protein VK577_03560 [Bradyrhizobium sp.]|nr:hypothetical protein [Bradyrhizobium sp.]
MAITRVQGNAAGAGSGASLGVTLGAAVGSGNSVCGWVSWGQNGTTNLSSVTDDKGNTYTISDRLADAVNAQAGAMFFLGNITNAPTVITANFSPSQSFLQIGADEYSGVLAATNSSDGHHVAAAVQTGSTATDFLSSGNFTTAVNGDLIYGVTIDTSNATLASTGTGYTQRQTNINQVDTTSEDKVQSTAGSVAATFTTSNAGSRYITFAVAIQPAAAGGTPTPYNPWRQLAPILAQ